MTKAKSESRKLSRALIYGLLGLVAAVALLSSYTFRAYLTNLVAATGPASEAESAALNFLKVMTDPKTVIVYIFGYVVWVLDVLIKVGLVVLVLSHFPTAKSVLVNPLATLVGEFFGVARKAFDGRYHQK